MAEYIEREIVVELLNNWADGYAYIEVPTKDAVARVRVIPAADVVPVVRCKYCRSQRWCKFAQYLGNDGFCSQGEYATNCGARMDGDA